MRAIFGNWNIFDLILHLSQKQTESEKIEDGELGISVSER